LREADAPFLCAMIYSLSLLVSRRIAENQAIAVILTAESG
jgi:hypothetical protein